MKPKFAALLIAVLSVMAIPTIASAKGTSNLIVITGPGIQGELQITDTESLEPLSMGMLETFPNALKNAPDVDPNSGYTLSRYFASLGSGGKQTYQHFDTVIFYLNPSGGPAYVYYEGIYNGSSEYDGKWFLASRDGEQAMKRVIAAATALVPAVPAVVSVRSELKPDISSLTIVVVAALVAALGAGAWAMRPRPARQTS